jgi:uncharacterized protein HemY
MILVIATLCFVGFAIHANNNNFYNNNNNNNNNQSMQTVRCTFVRAILFLVIYSLALIIRFVLRMLDISRNLTENELTLLAIAINTGGLVNMGVYGTVPAVYKRIFCCKIKLDLS